MSKEITIAGKTFRNKTAAKEHAKSILNSYKPGDTVSPEDTEFLIDSLLLRGEAGLDKIGCGVLSIRVDGTEFRNQCFVLRRFDGTEADFSYIKCFQKQNDKANFIAACRTAIWKDKPFKPMGYHVHHKGTPFKDIVIGFIEDNGIDPLEIEIEGMGDMETEKSFRDPEMSELFRQYHAPRAELEVLSVEDHKAKHHQSEEEVTDKEPSDDRDRLYHGSDS
jgi:hypothetical protein